MHSLGVAEEMKKEALKRYPENQAFAEDMFYLGMVHDVGYEFSEDLKKHGEVGG